MMFPLLILCLMVQVTAALGQLNFNVTLSSLTNHNISAFSNYNQSTYGANFGTTTWVNQNGQTMTINPALEDESLNPITPGHVSRVDVHTLIPSRPDLRWFAHAMLWFGASGHISIGYISDTTNYVAAMINDMESRGFNGIVIAWYGKGAADGTDKCAQLVKAYLASSANTNKNFRYMLQLESSLNGGTNDANIISNIDYCQTNYFNDPNYETEPVTNGNPILLFFGMRAKVGESAMVACKDATDANTIWVEQGSSYLGEDWENMSFQWTDNFDTGVNASDPFNLNAVTNDFSAIKSHNTKQAFGAMCAHFDGTLTKSVGWSEGKYLPSSNGVCEITRANTYNTYIAGMTNMTRMQWATWSDWEEGTEVEDGTENNFALTTQMNTTNVLGWTITSGDERTIDHYDVYAQTNGGNAAYLCPVPTGIYQTNISQLGLTQGSYKLYVNAVGKPCIRDHMSSPLVYVISAGATLQSDLQPLFQTVWQSDPVSFAVVGAGVAPLNYQWFQNGQTIAGATNASYSFGALTGTNFYWVAISNSLGSVSSSTGEVVGVTGTFLSVSSNYYGMQITFSGYTNGTALQDFPVLVRLSTNIPGFAYSQFVSPTNGADLRFTSEAGRELAFQIDQWNPAGESLVWVQVPAIASTNDYITAYWGNTADSGLPADTTNGAAWTTLDSSNAFELVYHLNESGFPFADATLQYPSTNGLAPSSTNGVVGLGDYFARAPYLDAGPVNLGNAFTLSAWANVSSGVSDIQCVWANGTGVAGSAEVFFYVNDYKTSDGALVLASGNGTTAGNLVAPAGSVSLNQWHLLTAVVDRNDGLAQLYVDGNQVVAGAIRNDFPTSNDMDLGRDTGGSFGFLGSLDETRIQSGLSSANWVWASWATVADNAFATYGTVISPNVVVQCQMTNGQLGLTWATGTLQSAPTVTGPFTDMTGAVSPYLIVPSAAQQYFRIKIP